MRLFVAVDISSEARIYVKKLQDSISAKLSFVPPENLHITLKFLGEAEPETVSRKLQEVEFTPFSLTTSDLGVFPNRNNPRVVWLGVEGNDKLEMLARDVRKALTGKEDYAFHAHITIARVKYLKDKQGFLEEIGKLPRKKISWEVDDFKLMKSELTPQGAVYEEIGIYS